MLRMHCLISGYPRTDHKDHNGLNNQRSNLRQATGQQNSANVSPHKGAASRYKGVTWAKQRSKWKAQIGVNGSTRGLGDFASEIQAAMAYDRAAIDTFGEFACTNAMMGLYPTQSQYTLAA